MLAWLSANIWTIVICLVLIAIVARIIVKMVRDKKAGVSSCSCGCSGCSGSCGAGSDSSKKKS